MSDKAKKIKNYFKSGLWTKQQVYNVVGKPLGITEEEYKEITGETYKK